MSPFKLDLSLKLPSEQLVLPLSYTEIKPTKGGKPDPPARTLNENIDFPSSISIIISITEESTAWLNKLKEEPGPICN